MIIHEIVGNKTDFSLGARELDLLQLEWFEASKRIQRRTTLAGREIAVKFLKEGQTLHQDDILFIDDSYAVVVDILPCDAIIVHPQSLLEMGSVCYEIGNKHLPMFIQSDEVLMPFEEPIYRWLTVAGYNVRKEHVKLLNMLNANVPQHGHSSGSSIFSKIIDLASKAN